MPSKKAVPAPEPRLLTVKAAAAYLSATVWAVRTLGWSKQIPTIKIGRGFLFDREDLDRYIEQQKAVGR